MGALSIIVPVLNEEGMLPRLLRSLAEQRDIDAEIVVADGGSTDRSPDIAKQHGARLIVSGPGRGRQMNAAVRASRSDLLLFLHADSTMDDPRLLAGAHDFLCRQIRNRGNDRVAGHFRLHFERAGRENAQFWRFVEGKTAFNRPYTTNGDQGLLIARRYFEELGGFDESLPFLEDQRIAARIRETGAVITLPGTLITSARRFEEAACKQYLLMGVIMAMERPGLDGFLAQMKQVPRVPGETLRLTPYLQLARKTLIRGGPHVFLRNWLQIGQLGRESLWQVAYLADVLLRPVTGGHEYPALGMYERLLEPLTRNRVADAVGAITLAAFLYAVLLPWCHFSERGITSVSN